MSKEVLIIFVKNPELGKVKTRLAKSIGDAQALAVYFKLLRSCFDLTESLSQDVVIYYNNYIDSEDHWRSDRYKKYLQEGKNIGEKMSNAIAEQISLGYENVCLIGSDIYDLSEEVICKAFGALKSKDIVIGPALDGGYYLIGMKKANGDIFNISKWSTDTVLKETIEKIKQQGLSYEKMTQLNDIDTIDDLRKTDLIKPTDNY